MNDYIYWQINQSSKAIQIQKRRPAFPAIINLLVKENPSLCEASFKTISFIKNSKYSWGIEGEITGFGVS